MKLLCLVLAIVLLTGCAPSQPAAVPEQTATISPAPQAVTEPPETEPPTTEPPDPVLELLESMSTEELVGQLFLARYTPETAVPDLEAYHLGGFILFAEDFQNETPESILQEISLCQSSASIPLLMAVDEEGGTVCRVSAYPAFRNAPFASPRELYNAGGMDLVLGTEAEKAYLLSSLGINVNMAPVCDISTTPGAFMYRRSLGQSPEITGEFAIGSMEMMDTFQVGSVLKHFPGYGNNADTHTGMVTDKRTLQQLESEDLIPFAMAIREGCHAILVSHTIVQAMDDQLPASLSPAVHSYLRSIMGFKGVIVTDDLVMGAITDRYGAGEAAVMAVLAGNDLLCSTEYPVQYAAVLEAVENGRIPRMQLTQAAERVLRWKQHLGLIT